MESSRPDPEDYRRVPEQEESLAEAIYQQGFDLYRAATTIGQFEIKNRSKPLLWCMLIVLISNPLIGVYLIRHFWNPEYHGAAATVTIGTSTLVQLAGQIRHYTFYSVFGELIFALFCLILLCTSNYCCTNAKQRTQSMIPCFALVYAVMYKILALYILIHGSILFMKSLLASFPWLSVYTVYLGPTVNGYLPTEPLDVGFKVAVVFTLENIYITLADSVEFIATLIRVSHRAIKRLIQGKDIDAGMFKKTNIIDPTASRIHNSLVLFDTLLNKGPTVQEGLIADMYHRYVGDIGTYMDNIDANLYARGIEQLGEALLGSQLQK